MLPTDKSSPDDSLFPWPRPRYVAGGGDALVFFEVYGEFEPEPAITLRPYNSGGIPEGVEILRTDTLHSEWDGPMAKVLQESNPAAMDLVVKAPHTVRVLGTMADPNSLNYLRDIIGAVTALLDAGGGAVIDPQTLQSFTKQEWRETFFDDGFEPTKHAVIFVSPEAGGQAWLHTRGMRLFGRPDISCHGVRAEEMGPLQSVFNGLIRMQAAGAIIPEGQPVRGVGVEELLYCQHRGDLEDPDFNNVHLELVWETPRA